MPDKSPISSNLAVPVLFVLIVALSFMVGTLWTKVQMLESGQADVKVSGRGGGGQAAVGAGNQGTSAPSVGGELGSADNLDKLSDTDYVKGKRDARILLVEYSDLECPFCKQFHPTAQKIVDEYEGKVAWVYRHFPIVGLHSKAPKEAEAVECAAEQKGSDGFWKLIDKIYEVTPANNGLDLDDLPKLAEEVGLDGDKLKTCMDSGKYKDKVEAGRQSGLKAGVTGTPGNFLFDTKTGKAQIIRGALPYDSIKPMIDSMLAES